ncbi:MAG: CHRD domain-containing protein [Acidimicrobiales bacterium]
MRRLAILAAALATVLAACGSDQDPALEAPEADGAGDAATTTVDLGAQPVEYEVALSGDTEVPGPGDPDGTGRAVVRLETSVSQVCYEIAVEGIGEATAAHIHEAPAGQSGGVVLPLQAPIEGSALECSEADEVLLQRLASEPATFYVNVHNDEFPDGALRGQLG